MSITNPGERGRLAISLGAVSKIVEYAADSVPETTVAQRKVAGVGIGEQRAKARIRKYGNEIDVAIDVALRYPSPIRRITAAIRDRIREMIQYSTGYRVDAINVTVSALRNDLRPRVE